MNILITTLISAFFITAPVFGETLPETGMAVHPQPTEPVYLSSSYYESLKKAFPPVPRLGSSTQKNDEKLLVYYQKKRTELDCQKAAEEVKVDLVRFFAKPHGPLEEKQLTIVAPFLNQVRNDADYFIQKLKVDFPRQRPYLYLTQLNPCIKKERTNAYPSGHGALAKLYADILSELYPKDKVALEARAKEIGIHRVMGGVHHPSDIEAGRKLADILLKDFKKSKTYLEAIQKLQKESH